jgi:uncharacterized protein YggU (UPF0235/DUF167 family)
MKKDSVAVVNLVKKMTIHDTLRIEVHSCSVDGKANPLQACPDP